MNQPAEHPRPVCATCLRPQTACICQWITPVANMVDVLILQHPQEVHAAKGSARLLHLSLQRNRLAVGEAFDETELAALLHDGRGDVRRQPVLLYPDTPDRTQSPARRPVNEAVRDPSRIRLVILDATWRKSRRMLRMNPLLQSLPRLALDDVPASRYRIRKAHREGQLSTLEAACHALMQLEGEEGQYGALLEAFDGFVMQQARWFLQEEGGD
ncbi:MAG TPA: tRNA-uridine aminocarboxypropyltransferase [Noviherbaspirillum sp.]